MDALIDRLPTQDGCAWIDVKWLDHLDLIRAAVARSQVAVDVDGRLVVATLVRWRGRDRLTARVRFLSGASCSVSCARVAAVAVPTGTPT